MRTLIKIHLIFGVLLLLGCSKGNKIERKIDGGTWNAVSYTTGYYNAAGIWQTTVDTFTGTVEFNKDGTCDWFGEKGTYECIGPAGQKGIEGYLDVNLPNAYLHMAVIEFSRRKLSVRNDGGLQSAYGTGSSIEYKFEKD